MRYINNLLKKIGAIDCVSEHHFIYRNLNTNSTVVDLGANKGEFYYAIKNKYGCKCILVEPNLELFDNLKTTHEDLKCNVVVASKDGEYTFYNSTNNEAGSLNKDMAEQWEIANTQRVTGWSFERMINEAHLSEIDLLKIDIEGAELELLDSLSYEQLATIKQITCEFHDFMDITQREGVIKVIDKLKRSGFFVLNFSLTDHRDVLVVNKRGLSFNTKIRLIIISTLLNYRRG